MTPDITLEQLKDRVERALDSDSRTEDQEAIAELGRQVAQIAEQMTIAGAAILSGVCPNQCEPCMRRFNEYADLFLGNNPWIEFAVLEYEGQQPSQAVH